MNAKDFKARLVAQEHVTVYQSPDPQRVYAYSPGLTLCPNGRLIATLDQGGPGVEHLEGVKATRTSDGPNWQGKIYTSDDKGKTWQFRDNFAALHSRPFMVGNTVYILGQAADLVIYRSDDLGNTWDGPHYLTEDEYWHQAPSNVHYANDCVYLVMEIRRRKDIRTWPIGENAPVLLRGRLDADLTKRENWTFASELSFRDVIPNVEEDPEIDYFGIPFYKCPYPHGTNADGIQGRNCAPIGWLETNVVQFSDPNHYWYDPEGKTFHLWMRAHTGGTGYACIAKVVEKGDKPGTGEMETMLETVPSGKKILYTPCPGGHNKFHVLYDEKTKLYWLLSVLSTDSMTRADRLPADRFNLPNNERRRLQLHFSRNMIDWCFAARVAEGDVEVASRHYASMVIDGEDMHILSRSGDENAKNPHDGNIITFHSIQNFRELVYII